MADRDCEFLRSGNSASQERTHTGDNPYECDVCKKRFTQSRRLVLHIKRTHTRDTHECDICKKRFAQSSILVRHKITHSEDKPYECDVCKKKFKVSNHLVLHTADSV